MPRISNAQIPPPKNWEEFEDICFDLWKSIWKDPNSHKNGRKGQPQAGVDIYGQPFSSNYYAGVQCKGKDDFLKGTLSEKELDEEIEKAKTFKPPLKSYIIATTQPRDVRLQEIARLRNENLKETGFFEFSIFFWEDIIGELDNYDWIVKKYWEQFFLKEETTGIKSEDYSFDDKKISMGVDAQIVKQEGLIVNQVYYLTDSLSSVVTDKYNADVDFGKDLILNYKPGEALSYLKKLKDRIWGEANPHLKFRILTNLASSHLGINDIDKAAKLYIEALQYNPNDEKALANCALGYLLLKDYTNAKKFSQDALEKNPVSGRSFSVYLQSLSNDHSIEELEGEIPYALKDDPEVLHSIGFLCRLKNDFKKAEFYLEKAFAGDRENSIEIMNSYATIILENVTQANPIISGLFLNENEITRLKRSLELLNQVWMKCQDLQIRKARIGVLVNRSLTKRILKDFWGAIADIDEVIKEEGEKPEFLKFKALLAIEIKDIPFAIGLLEGIHLNDKVPESDLILAELLDENGNTKKAIETLEDALERLTNPELKLDFIAMLTSLYSKNQNFEKAEELASNLVQLYPNSVNVLITLSNIENAKGNFEKCIAHLKEATKYCKNIKDKFLLSDELYKNGLYVEAVNIYETFIDANENNQYTRRYLASLYNTGNLGKALKIATALRLKFQPLKFITEIEIDIYERIGDLKIAIDLSSEYLIHYPDDMKIKIRRAFICLRQRDFEKVDEFIEKFSLEDYISLPIEYYQKMSLLFSERGKSLESLNILYEARRNFFNESKAHMIYVGAFFMRESDVDKYLDNEVVKINSAVYLKDRLGNKIWYVIEDRTDVKYSQNEIDFNHPLVKNLIGKKVGDKLLLSESNESFEVIEIKSKYVYALHQSMQLYTHLFPERKEFQTIALESKKDNKDELNFDPLFKQIDELGHFTREAEKLYLNSPLTIGGLSNYLHRNVFEVITGLMSKKDIGIRCCNGTVNERIEAFDQLKKSKILVIDIISILSVNEFNLTNVLLSIFDEIYVSQSTLDLLNETISLKRGLTKRGYTTIAKEEDHYIRMEIDATTIKKSIDFYNELIDWIKLNFRVAPSYETLNISRDEKEKLDRVFQFHFVESVLLAKEKNALLYSDDYKLRSFAKAKYQVNGFWTQLILIDLLNKGLITNDEYENSIVKLSVSNFRHTSISSKTLKTALEKASWQPISPFVEVAEILNGINSDLHSSVLVVVSFIKELNELPLIAERKQNIIFLLLNKLSYARNPKIVIDNLLFELNNALLLLPLYQDEVLKDIEAWTKVNFS